MTKQQDLDARIHSFLDTKFKKYPDVERSAQAIIKEVNR